MTRSVESPLALAICRPILGRAARAFCAVLALSVMPTDSRGAPPSDEPQRLVRILHDAGQAARILPEAEQPDWNAVGRINMAGYKTRRMCTGTLIGPDTVLTAAHCVIGPDGRPAAPGEIVFVAGWRAGEAAADARGASLRVHPAFGEGRGAGEIRIAADLALLTLERPLVGIAPIPVGPLPAPGADGALAIVGYRADRPHIVSRTAPCGVDTRAPDAFRTPCPVVYGTSGAPVLADTEAGWRVVGVVSASTPDGTLAAIPTAWDALPPG